MVLAREETFGPVAPLFKFESDDEVIRLANATEFGLASYFYAKDLSRVFRVAEALDYGMVGINTGLISTEVAPFGGVKQSGHGREGSKYGTSDYLDIKYLSIAV
jgi:succinate-semialdehyde dehydrogenase/glutarate-semialdehyde dehydrogenase